MKLHLSRREAEKVWNVLNEIKGSFLSSSEKITIPFLGGWALKAKKEGMGGPELNQLLNGRTWAFKFVESKDVITKLKLPRPHDPDGVYTFFVNENKFDKFYKSHRKAYIAKATAYQQRKIDEIKPREKINLADFGKFEKKHGEGFLICRGKRISLGKEDGRKSKLVEFLWHKDRLGSYSTINAVFDEIGIKKDKSNGLLKNPITSSSEKTGIIRGAIKEIQRSFTKNNLNKIFNFSTKNNVCSVKPRNP